MKIYYSLVFILLLISCEVKQELELDTFISSLEDSEFFKSSDKQNLYTRNNIFNYAEEGIKATYSMKNNDLKYLKITSSISVDSVLLRRKILKIIDLQDELKIIGFEKNKNNSKFYFKVDLIKKLPIEISESDNMAVLVYTRDESSISDINKYSSIPDYDHWFLQTYNAKFGLPNY